MGHHGKTSETIKWWMPGAPLFLLDLLKNIAVFRLLLQVIHRFRSGRKLPEINPSGLQKLSRQAISLCVREALNDGPTGTGHETQEREAIADFATSKNTETLTACWRRSTAGW